MVQELYLAVTHEVRLLLYFKLMVCSLCQGSDIVSLSLLSDTDLLTSDLQSVSISVNLLIGTCYFFPSSAISLAFKRSVITKT